MCGIAGFIEPARSRDSEESELIVRSMASKLARRGPDDEGTWADAEAGVALGHRRLSILDLSEQGHQTMHSPDGRYVAFTYGGAGSFQVFVADVASGQLIQITSQGRNESPTWSPDSRHISFQSNRSGRWEVWQSHIDGTGQRQLTRGGGRSPSWAK